MSRLNNPENSLAYFIRGAFREFETALSRHIAAFDLPLSQFYILRLQWNQEGVTQIDIASRAFMSESVASQVLKKMEAKDLLRRKPDPEDHRSRLVHLTSKGKTLRENILKEGIEISKKNAPTISSQDIKTTIEVLIKVRQGFEDYNSK